MDAAVWPCKEISHVWPFVVSGIVPDHVDNAFIRIARLDPGEKLRRADPVHGGRLDKGCIEVFQVERTMDVHAPASCGGCHGGGRACLYPAVAGFCLVFGMHRIGEIHGFICAQTVQQLLVHIDECGLLFGRCNAWQPLRLSIFEPQSGQKLDAAGMGVVQIEFLRNTGSDRGR